MPQKSITLMVITDDRREPKQYRMPLWLYRALQAIVVLSILAPIAYVILYYEVIARAADADRLLEENASLRRYQYKVEILEQSLLETQQMMAQVAEMAGLDSVLLGHLYTSENEPAPPNDLVNRRSLSRTLPPTSPIPDGLPATGWITQGFSEIPGKRHPGVDLALPVGAPVFSTAFGEVVEAGFDSVFGLTVVVRHDSIETVYGHNSELLVQVGDTIFAGQRIALSGNSGISSAPHLHYEIRIHGIPINPMKFFVYENQTR